jgi:PQQ-like domain
MPRRRRLLLALVGLGVAIGGLWWVLTPATRFVYGLSPIGRDEAVLLTRRNEDHATHFWVQLVREDGAVVWSTETSPLAVRDALGFSGVAASDGRVVLLGERDQATVVLALGRSGGEQLWEREVSSAPQHRIGPMLVLDGPRVYALHDHVVGERSHETITALALEDGEVLWTLAAPHPEDEPRRLDVALRGPGRLVVTNGTADAVIELDGQTGEARRSLPMRSQGCSTPRGIVGYDTRKLVWLPGPMAGGPEASPRVVELGPDVRPSLDGPCGEHGDDIVIGAALGDRDIGLVRVGGEDGTVRWTLPLGDWSFQRSTSADGRLPRFLPVGVYGTHVEGGPMLEEVIVVDLEQGTIVSRNPIEDHRVAFVTAEQAYVMGTFSRVLVALDPATGGIARATHFPATTGNDVHDEDYRFGRLWLFGMGWGRPTELSWAVIDLEGSEPPRVHGEIVAVDVTAGGWARPY